MAAASPRGRVQAIDAVRGLAVVGMLLVMDAIRLPLGEAQNRHNR
jgi:uncharacterized membrane protein YeiB